MIGVLLIIISFVAALLAIGAMIAIGVQSRAINGLIAMLAVFSAWNISARLFDVGD